jgi:N,N'-diacetyllegionaminate synthase
VSVTFGPFELGGDAPVLVIAEIGVNHNGERALGLRQIRAALHAGARAVKFQTFKADELATHESPKAAYQETALPESQHRMLRRLELSRSDFAAYRTEAAALGALAFSTPFDPESAGELAEVGVELMKVPSGEITNDDLVATVGRTRLPTIMSTGMSTIDEVAHAVDVFTGSGGGPLALLHCVSSYPAPLEELNLRAMVTLRERFRVPVGLSDHSIGRDAAVAAVALGADIVEKHFTVDRTLPGPDHAMSMEPDDFAQMVRVLEGLRLGLGNGVKGPTAAEMEIRQVARRSIVAATDLPAGTLLTRAHLALKRPGDGLAPQRLSDLVGRRIARHIRAEEPIRDADLTA